MGKQFLMTWDGKCRRWFKKYNGSRFVVSCRQLQVEATKHGSYLAANRWWQVKQAHVDAEIREARREPIHVAHVGSEFDVDCQPNDVVAVEYHGPVRNPETAAQQVTDMMLEAFRTCAFPALPSNESDESTIGTCIKKWLEVKQSGVTIDRWESLRCHLDIFGKWVGVCEEANSVNGLVLADFHAYLLRQVAEGTWAPWYAKTILTTVKSFVRWCYETERIEQLPRNINSRALSIKVVMGRPKTINEDTLRKLFDSACERSRLYALLRNVQEITSRTWAEG